MREMATEQEVLEFCNAVRKAGGGSAIQGLFPSIPQKTTQCLIAKGLNFGCAVGPYEGGMEHPDAPLANMESEDVRGAAGLDEAPWVVEFDDPAVARRVATELDLFGGYAGANGMVVLPDRIAAVASTFDDAADGEEDAVQTWVAKYLPDEVKQRHEEDFAFPIDFPFGWKS